MVVKKMWRQTDYPNTPYTTSSGFPKGATVASGGCGIISTLNLLYNYIGKISIGVSDMVNIARSSGARYNGGTDVGILLSACKEKWGGFTYKKCTSDSEMRKHLSNGGCCIAHTTGSYPLFSKSGHFVAFYGVSGNKINVMDSFWYSSKWTENSIRKSNIKTTSTKGVVAANYAAVCQACDYYYLVTKVSKKKTSSTPPNFIVGNVYTLSENLKLRSSAETGNNVKLKSDVKVPESYMLSGKYAVIKKGVKITCKSSKTTNEGVFVKSSSGWLLAWNSQTRRVNIE